MWRWDWGHNLGGSCCLGIDESPCATEELRGTAPRTFMSKRETCLSQIRHISILEVTSVTCITQSNPLPTVESLQCDLLQAFDPEHNLLARDCLPFSPVLALNTPFAVCVGVCVLHSQVEVPEWISLRLRAKRKRQAPPGMDLPWRSN